MTTTSTEKDMMIVKEPREDDVLLGQGHYRHQGNQKLNKIVDAKVDEYKNQSRVFKTYMAHDIINRMRNKGVRFLKELAPKGWVVVKDDKEAREKVAQRFQYMMRKQAAEAKANAKNKSGGVSNTNSSKAKAVASPRLNLNWNGVSVKVPFLPVFHQLQKSSVLVDDDINAIAKRLQECFGIIKVQDSFNTEEANATLTAPDNLKMRMNLWKPLGGNRGVIVELINLEGDVLKFQKFSRYILEACTGLFAQYQHTLFQGGAKGCVEDHVTAFTTTKTTAKIGPEEVPPATMSLKAGGAKGLGERALQDGGKKKAPPGAEKREHINCPMKRPTVKRGALANGPKESKLAPFASASKSAPKSIPSSGTRPTKRETGPAAKREIDANGERGATFASAFSRWQTGVGRADKTSPDAGSEVHARRPSTAASSSGFNHNVTAFAVEPRYQGIAGQQEMEVGLSLAASSEAAASDTANATGNAGQEEVQLMTPTAASSEVKTDAINATIDAGTPLPQSAPSSAVLCPYPDSAEMMMSMHSAQQEPPAQDLEVAQEGVRCPESIEPLPLEPADGDPSDRYSEGRRVPAFDRWAAAPSNHQEMKCDSSIEEKQDTEMVSIGHTIESMKRLSISSSDASYVETRMSRDRSDVFVGLLPRTLSNQDMKCDSSFDDEPYDAGNLMSTQSFLPSSFFGAPAPAATLTNFRVHNPPSPAHSFCSHISVEMRSTSPAPSSVGVFSVPSPCGSFNSRCSLGVNSLKHARMDEALSPSMFESDQSTGNEPRASQLDALAVSREDEPSIHGEDLDPLDVVPPTIFVDSSSTLLAPPV